MRIGLISALHEKKYETKNMDSDIPIIPVWGSMVKDKTYDYIVVEAGTAGMTIGKYSQQLPWSQGEMK
jgi:hypothetical protein